MNYKESAEILAQVRKAKRILINCHQSPDPDSFSTALSLRWVLQKLGKKVDVVCTSETSLMREVSFMKGYKDIKNVDFNSFDFSDYDLLISPDSADWKQVVGSLEIPKAMIKIVVIDHHVTNKGFGDINLIDVNKSSCAEALQLVFEDWGIKLDPTLATLLLVGIVGDTAGFQYPGTSKSLNPAMKLLKSGGRMDDIMFNLYRNKSFNSVKVIGEFLNTLTIDNVGNFSYMALPYEIYKKYGKPPKISTYVANMLSNVVKGTLFGITMIEFDVDQTNISLRARGDFDVSKIAIELGGGGHKITSAASIRNKPFEKAVKIVLEVSRKYAKAHKKV